MRKKTGARDVDEFAGLREACSRSFEFLIGRGGVGFEFVQLNLVKNFPPVPLRKFTLRRRDLPFVGSAGGSELFRDRLREIGALVIWPDRTTGEQRERRCN